ncbi:MAG: hypothetical protein GAK41_01048 [Burkholderia gladioli]|nr:MAG: hypothetical protein GAK41_01048 [Burkholderia gladioli]
MWKLRWLLIMFRDLTVRHRLGLDSLLQQPVEEQAAGAGGSPIEAKNEFIEIVLELDRLDSPLMGAE